VADQRADALEPRERLHVYTIVEVLGAGGFGITYLAEEEFTTRKVAIKEFMPTTLAFRSADGVNVTPINKTRRSAPQRSEPSIEPPYRSDLARDVRTAAGRAYSWRVRRVRTRLDHRAPPDGSGKQGAGRPQGSGAIYGYRWAGKGRSRCLKPVEREARNVRFVFSAFLRLQNLCALTRLARQAGLRTRSGKPFARSAIRYVLCNPFYTGQINHARLSVRGVHERIVMPEQFKRVRSILGSASRAAQNHHRST
jgi:serine/threonine protein kinase